MISISFKLEDLLPLLSNMPRFIKISFIILFLCNLIWLFVFSYFYYRKNTNIRLTKSSTKLNRLFKDYEDKIEDIKYEFNKECRMVEAYLIHQNNGLMSNNVSKTYNNILNNFVQKLDGSLEKLKINVEDIILEYYDTTDIDSISNLKKENTHFIDMIKLTNQTQQYFERELKDVTKS